MVERAPVAYLEAVVRIPLYAEDRYGPDGPGDWWEYHEPGASAHGLTTCSRQVTEIGRRLLEVEGET